MALPDAIKTVNVTFGPGTSTLGTDLEIDVAFSAPVAVVWAATGTPLINLIETERAEAGETGTAVLPNPAQDGFIDGDGNPIRDWTYRATAKYKRDGLKVAGPFTKTFALSETDTDVHLDKLIPVPTSNGVVVAIPDTWTQAVSDAQAAAAEAAAAAATAVKPAELDAKTAALISTDGSATQTQLNDTFVASSGPAFLRVKTSADIQAKIDAVPAGGGFAILDADAEYVIDEPLVIENRPGLKIAGQGRSTVLKAASGLNDSVLKVGVVDEVTEGFGLYSLSIDGNASNQSIAGITVSSYAAGDGTASEGKGYGLIAYSMEDMRIFDVAFRNCYNSGFRHQGARQSDVPDSNVSYRDIWLQMVLADGNRNGGLELSQKFRQVHLVGVHADNNGGHGIYADHSEAEYVNVAARKNGFYGIFIHNVQRCSYNGLHAYNNSRHGIFVDRLVESVGNGWFAHNNGALSSSNGSDIFWDTNTTDGYGPTRNTTITNIWVGAATAEYLEDGALSTVTENWGIYFQDGVTVAKGTAFDHLKLLDVHVGPTLTGAFNTPTALPSTFTLSPADRPASKPGTAVPGQSTMARQQITSSAVSPGSGGMRLMYFTADTWGAYTKIRIPSGAGPAASGLTTCRVGVYWVDDAGKLTELATTANDTTMFTTANTAYVKDLSATVKLEAGRLYAIGVLQVGTTPAKLIGQTGNAGVAAESAILPRMSAALTGQTDLPASPISDSALSTNTDLIYAVLVP